jgi:transposase
VDVGDGADGAAVSLAESQRSGSQYTTTLKKECPTRWNSLLTMMESLLKSRQLVERCLASLRLFDKIPPVEDWQIIQDLVNFLQVFKKATELLSGSQYPTCSMALLFRSELASALEACTSDSSVIAELKRNIRARFDYRYPVIARSHSARRSAVSRVQRRRQAARYGYSDARRRR